MKKLSLILTLTLVLVGAFAAVALADLTHPNNAGNAITNVYLPGDPSTYPIHSSYTANTDACAACHAAHTGAGEALLQWDTSLAGITAACMACHDGTVTKTYDVKDGQFIPADAPTTTAATHAGLFAKTLNATDTNASEHAVFGTNTINSAYGGAMRATATTDQNGKWTDTFSCASCHTPHGQGANGRILDPNPNLVQTKGVDPSTFLKTATPVDSFAVTTGQTTVTLSGRAILGYPYSMTVKNNTTSLKDVTNFLMTLDANKNTVLTFNAPLAGGTLTATYVPALKVDVAVTNKLLSNETVSYPQPTFAGTVGDSAATSGLIAWCGACHTDYNTSAVHAATGNASSTPYVSSSLGGYSTTAYSRHNVGHQFPYGTAKQVGRGLVFEGQTLSCITCHVAHGANQANVWAPTATSTGITDYNSPELNGSSRLKRLPNMGVCEACHDKGEGNYSAYSTYIKYGK